MYILEKIIGLLIMGIGCFAIYYTYKKPIKFLKVLNFRAYIGGVGFIIIGFAIVIGKFHIFRVIISKFSGNG